MADVIDIANDRAEADLASSLKEAVREKRPAGMLPCGRCWECDIAFEDEETGHHHKLFCAAEEGQRRSECMTDYERRRTQRRMLGRGD
jgi:hypothetical protein